MNILVIGNGFDIAHGLNTSYTDFLEFVRAYRKDGGVNVELKEILSNNVWIDYFDSIFEERKSEGKDGWIDFESEISTVVEALDRALVSYNNFVENPVRRNNQVVMDATAFEILNRVLRIDSGQAYARGKSKYLLDIKKWKQLLLNDLNKLTRSLEIYLSSFLNKCNAKSLPIIENIKPDYVISFNYTETYEELYGRPSAIDYIHGISKKDSSIDNNNMVLGIGEFLLDERKDKDNEFIEFKKFYQRIFKSTGSKYKEWLKEFEDKKSLKGFNDPGQLYHELNIYIFGHSIDPTDGDILKDLIDTNHSNIYIYYHSKAALAKQIANLVRVIGEEKTIELTDNSKGRIKFISNVHK
jgi:hypothetical protein